MENRALRNTNAIMELKGQELIVDYPCRALAWCSTAQALDRITKCREAAPTGWTCEAVGAPGQHKYA